MNKRERIKLMGSVVTVTHVLRNESKCISTDWNGCFTSTWAPERISEPRAGWIVGFTHRRNGKLFYRGADGPTFKPTACVPCALVKYWPTLDAIEVPLDGFTVGGIPDNRHARWPATARAAFKQEAKSFPRRNGRFSKVS